MTSGATSGFEVNVPVAEVTDTTNGASWQQALTPYIEPVSYLSDQIIDITPDNLNITTSAPNVFFIVGQAGTG